MASADGDKLTADLSAYLDGELRPERAREIERLLAESEEARRTLADLRAVSQGLAALPRKRAPEGLAERVRRTAERQALLQDGARVGRTRVLKLFVRLTASAALIVACVFAGWAVLKEDQAPAPSVAKRVTVAAEQPLAVEKGAETYVRGPSREQPLEASTPDASAAQPVAEAPAVAMHQPVDDLGYRAPPDEVRRFAVEAEAEELRATEGEVAAALDADAAVPGELVVWSGDADADGAVPLAESSLVVNVIVAPRSAEEHDATLQTLVHWQQAPVATARRGVADAIAECSEPGARMGGWAAPAGRGGEVSDQAPRDYVVQVAPSEFNGLLYALDRQVPGQVQASMNFNARAIAQVQRMMTPPPEPEPHGGPLLADDGAALGAPTLDLALLDTQASGRARNAAALRKPAAGARFSAPGGRGRVVRGPADKGTKSAAPRASGGIDTGSLRALEGLGYIAEDDEAGGVEREAAAKTKEEAPRQRGGRLAPAAGRVPATPPLATVLPEAAEPRAPAPGRSDVKTSADEVPEWFAFLIGELHRCALVLGDRVDELYTAMLHLAFRTELADAWAEPQPEPLTVRVTLLPPPVATQPHAESGMTRPPAKKP